VRESLRKGRKRSEEIGRMMGGRRNVKKEFEGKD
jgi:hypothetical protein